MERNTISATMKEKKKMVLFPNQTITHPDDVRDRVQEEYHHRAGGAQPHDLFIDKASMDSFPASDAPPWTLGYLPPEVSQTEGNETMKRGDLIVSDADRKRLEALIDSARMDCLVREDYLAALEAELGRARILPPGEVPADVVTMNSVVRLRDLDSDEMEVCELVYPVDADMALNRISILAPIGTAILGYRLGDAIEWPVPAGLRRLRVEEVLYQPEKAGALHR
jgi:regulator of nucleoside diphosphate kinase